MLEFIKKRGVKMLGKVRIFRGRVEERGVLKSGIKIKFIVLYCFGSLRQCDETQSRNEEYDFCLLEKRKKFIILVNIFLKI